MWTMAESLEAHFGRFRVVINGTDVRGYWERAAAERHASHCRGKEWGKDARVRDSRAGKGE